MTTVKGIKKSKRTFTIVFDCRTIGDERELKALAMLFGYCNPLRNEMIDERTCYALVEAILTKGYIDWSLTMISRQLK